MADVRDLLEQAYRHRGDAAAGPAALRSAAAVALSSVQACGFPAGDFMAPVLAVLHDRPSMTWAMHCLSFLNEVLLAARQTLAAAVAAAAAGGAAPTADAAAAAAARAHVLACIPVLLKAIYECSAADQGTGGTSSSAAGEAGLHAVSLPRALLLVHLWHESGLLFPLPGEAAAFVAAAAAPLRASSSSVSEPTFADPLRMPVGLLADRLKLLAALPPGSVPGPCTSTPLDTPQLEQQLRLAAARAPRPEAGRFPARLADFCRKAEALAVWCEAGAGGDDGL